MPNRVFQFEHQSSSQDQTIAIEIESLENFADLDDRKITKVHGICINGGKFLMVHHSRWDIWGFPGGTREGNEPPMQTLERELDEEAACTIVAAKPLCLQTIKNKQTEYHLIYLCEVQIDRPFVGDPAGNIDQIAWLAKEEVLMRIEKRPFKQKIWELAFDSIKAGLSA